MPDRPLTVLHLFAGLGGAALGYQRAGFHSVGAFDVDPLACQALEYLTGERATCADLGTMTPGELRAACTGRPDVVALSPPCKSFSGCLPAAVAATDKYVDLSSLSLRGIWLALEAWAELPPPLFCLENVPRITTRGRHWLDQVTGLLHAYGYACAETVHDCGELGGLAQRRRRFLMVARHMKQVPDFLRVPPMRSLRGVGEVLGLLPVPLPGSAAGGPMHRLPKMSPMNWVRLALIPAGGDWRDLPPEVAINAGPDRHRGGFGVGDWDDPAKTVVGAADPRHKPVSVADPRLGERAGRQNGGFGVNEWPEPGHTVVAEGTVRNTWASVEDPRIAGSEHRHNGKYGVEEWSEPAHAVIAEARTGKAWAGVADPRVACAPRAGVYGVSDWSEPGDTVLASAGHDNGRASVADPRITTGADGAPCRHTPPRPGCTCGRRRDGAMGVTDWDAPSTAVIANGRHFNGPWQVADPRVRATRAGTYHVQGWAMPSHTVIANAGSKTYGGTFAIADPRIPEISGPPIDLASKRPTHLIIMAADGTWHRPMTTLELAALQGLPTEVNGAPLVLPGNDADRRTLIGNCVPPPAAEAIAKACAAALRAAGSFSLSSEDIWVAPTVEGLRA